MIKIYNEILVIQLLKINLKFLILSDPTFCNAKKLFTERYKIIKTVFRIIL